MIVSSVSIKGEIAGAPFATEIPSNWPLFSASLSNIDSPSPAKRIKYGESGSLSRDPRVGEM